MSEVAEKKRDVILNPQRFGLREHLRRDLVVTAEAGTTVGDVLEPMYWAHCATEMQPFNRIEVVLETGEWMLELLVINTGRNWAQVHVLHKHDLVARAEAMPAAQKHKVEWKGPQLKFCVIRLADSEVIQKELANKAAAHEWLTAYERTTSA